MAKPPLFPFRNRPHRARDILPPPDSERPEPQAAETRREAVLEKLLRRAMRRAWQVQLPDDTEDTIAKDRASVCRLLRITDPLSGL
jgi:hypothetical protein